VFRATGKRYASSVPPFLRTNLDTPKGELILAAGRDDDDRGLRIGYQSERYPRIKISPDGLIFTGDGLSEPATPFLTDSAPLVISDTDPSPVSQPTLWLETAAGAPVSMWLVT